MNTRVSGSAEYNQEPLPPQETQILKPETKPTFAYLIVRNGLRAGHVFSLRPDATTVGRDSDNHIIVDDTAVSRRQLKIRCETSEDGGLDFMLYDLATANGTKVNGTEVLKHRLADGDEVEIGQTVLVFKRV